MKACIRAAILCTIFGLLNPCAIDRLFAADSECPFLSLRPAKFRKVEVRRGNMRYKIRSEFPNIDLFELQPTDKRWLKSEIKKMLRAERKNFLRDIKSGIKALYIDGIPIHSVLESNCTVDFVSSDVVSIHVDFESCTADGRPMHFTKVLNFFLPQHKKIDLTDLFGPRHVTEALILISKYSRAVLNSKLQDVEYWPGIANWIDEGTEPNLENFKTFSITGSGLQFSFPEYQVAAYAFGPQQVLVPWAVLGDLVLRLDV